MFVRRLLVETISRDGDAKPCPVNWLDSFCMRNFTNDAAFDDTLPVQDGLLEVGLRVPLHMLETHMAEWLRRKGWLKPSEKLLVREVERQERA